MEDFSREDKKPKDVMIEVSKIPQADSSPSTDCLSPLSDKKKPTSCPIYFPNKMNKTPFVMEISINDGKFSPLINNTFRELSLQ